MHNSDRCSIVWVLFPDMKIGEKVRTKFRHLYNSTIERAWTPVLELTRKFQFNYHKSFQITRRQFPITLAAAKTVHKSQGSTLQSAVIKFGDTKIDHMHYVALSRVQKLSTLYLYNLDDKKIKVSTAVENEMKRLCQDGQKKLSIPLFYTLNGTSLKIVYHNARSLHRHLIDVKSDCNLLSADILAFSETRFQPTDTGDFNLPGFKIARFDSTSNLDTRPYHGQTVYDKCQGSLFWGNNVCNIEIVIGNVPFLDTRIHVCFIY